MNHFFDVIGKKLQLDILYFARSSMFGGIQQVIGIVFGLILSYFFGHLVSKKLFGDYNFILSVVSFLTIVTLPGLDNVLIYSLGQGFNSSLSRSVKWKFLSSLLGIPVLIGFAVFYYFQHDYQLTLTFLITGFFFPFLPPLQLANETFIAKQKFLLLSTYLSASSIISTTLILLSIFFFPSLPALVTCYFVGILLPSLFAFFHSRRFLNKSSSVDTTLFSASIYNTLISALPWASASLGQIILAMLLGTEQLAAYVVANKFTVYMQKNLLVFYQPLTAKLAQQSHREHLITLKKHALKLLLWGILLALPLYIFSPFLIETIFTNKYSDAIPLARLISIGIIPLPLSWVLADIVVFQNIQSLRTYSTIVLNIGKILLYFVLIPKFMIYGLVFAFLIDRYVTPLTNLVIIYIHNKSKTRYVHKNR